MKKNLRKDRDTDMTTNERPLENMVTDGGFCGIFETIGCVGDSLSSGEFESLDENGVKKYHDYYRYSWGQFMARACGSTVYNFSRGGMTASAFNESFGEQCGFYLPEKRCQAYIIALGVNDILNRRQEIGSAEDICPEDPGKNARTFSGEYGKIIQKIKEMQPKARVFLMTMPRDSRDEERSRLADLHAKLLYEIADMFEYTYILDFRRYAPVYDEEFRKNYFLGGHMNAAGYLLTAKYVMSYIDYIIRHNMEDFSQIGFVGTGFHNCSAKW